MIKAWEYEPQTFYFEGIKRGTTNYKPDFWVLHFDGKTIWYEVKGWMDPKSATKIKRFRKYFPDKTLIVIDKLWFQRNNANMKLLIKDWETHAISKRKIKSGYFKKYSYGNFGRETTKASNSDSNEQSRQVT